MDSIDRPSVPFRQLVLFVFVFLVPFVVLTGLAIRTLRQDRDPGLRRDEDERRALVNAVRQEFLGRLATIKLQAQSGATERRDNSGNPLDAIVLVARIDDAHLVLPWENQAAAADVRRILAEQPFAGWIS